MVAVVWLVVFGVTGSIPKRDAHIYIYIYTLSENRVPIICLALRRSAINYLMPESSLVPKSYSLFPYLFVALLNSIPIYFLNFEFFIILVYISTICST